MEREIDASADEVWQVLGERFGELSWSSGITGSSLEGELGVGAVRVCEFPPNMFARDGTVKEKLLTFDREAMKFSYQPTTPLGPMKDAINRWTITPLGPRRCKVSSHATVQLRAWAWLFAPFMGPMLRKLGEEFLDDLIAEVERLRTTRASAA